jgi:hypothetical protein
LEGFEDVAQFVEIPAQEAQDVAQFVEIPANDVKNKDIADHTFPKTIPLPSFSLCKALYRTYPS